ncbi:MAG: hypothetical protein ACYCUG_17135, partial [Acidimicrobiales bacterium]
MPPRRPVRPASAAGGRERWWGWRRRGRSDHGPGVPAVGTGRIVGLAVLVHPAGIVVRAHPAGLVGNQGVGQEAVLGSATATTGWPTRRPPTRRRPTRRPTRRRRRGHPTRRR